MSAITRSPAFQTDLTRSRLRRLLIPIAAVIGAALVVFGLRAGADYGQRYWIATHSPRAAVGAPMPVSSQIEDQWGIRFTQVQLMGSNGLVELRYQVLDSTKAGRLHADSTSLSVIPSLRVEGLDVPITSRSLMFHVHNDWTQNLDGKVYSIIYGNPGGAVYVNGLVTIVMSDGLQLRHVPVRG